MNNLAISYVALRRYDDALAIRRKVLEFFRRILPEDHPNIGDNGTSALVVMSAICVSSHAAFQTLPWAIWLFRSVILEGMMML